MRGILHIRIQCDFLIQYAVEVRERSEGATNEAVRKPVSSAAVPHFMAVWTN
jgi:hypothetical protein